MSSNRNYILNDNFPKSIGNATSTRDGLMSSQDKARLDSVFEFGLLTPATSDKDGIMSKEDKIKLDGIEDGANNYVHPDDTNTRHVTDAEKTKWNNQIKYTNINKVPETIGGIEIGTTFNNMDYKDLFNKLLYPYQDPVISNIEITPATNILEKGTRFTLTRIKFNINTPSIDLSNSIHYDFKMGETKFHQIDATNRTIDTTTNTSITDTTTINVTVVDKINSRETTIKLLDYEYVYPFYYGTTSLTSITQSVLKNGIKLVQVKSDKSLIFNTNNQRMIFAYPKIYGKLSSIIDMNNFNLLNSFDVSEITVSSNDSANIVYYVYSNEPSTVSNFSIKFIF